MGIKDFLLDSLFPKFCVNCQKEGYYLCPDCFSLIDVIDRLYCPYCQEPFCSCLGSLNSLYFSADKNSFILKKLLKNYRQEPFVRGISEALSDLIIIHLVKVGKKNFSGYNLLALPFPKKELKQRGFSPSLEIAKLLSKEMKIPLIGEDSASKKKIILVSDIYTEEFEKVAFVLKKSKAKEVIAMASAR